MNNSVKFTSFSLHSTDSAELKASKEAYRLRFKDGWRRVGRCAILLVALMIGSVGTARADNYVFMYVDGGTYHIMANISNTITDVQQFSYTTCVWSGSNNQTFSNQGRYLYWTQNNSVWTANTSGDNLTINGYKIYNTYNRNNYYIRYNNSQWLSSTTNDQNNVVYALSGPQDASWTTPVSISGSQTTFTNIGSFTYSADAAYRPAYYTLTGNGGPYYVVEGGTPSSSAPTGSSSGITYTWTLNDGTNDDGHVRINATTGEVTYYNSYASNTNTTIKVTATHTASNATTSTTKTLTFNAIDVTSITVSEASVTAYVGETLPIGYTLSPTGAYDHVAATSSNTGIFTVPAWGTVGSVTITPVATGSATLTLTAYKLNGTTVSPSAIVTVNVHQRVATPVISIAANGDVTITCATEGASIYYTTDGSTPTSGSTPYSETFNVANLTTVKAKAFYDGFDDSEVASDQYVNAGLHGGLVILDDREEHSWAYYSSTELPNMMRSLNPADVKITYYGNSPAGRTTMTSSTETDNTPTTFSETATGVAVDYDAPENTFVYYKTLEKAGTGNYPYTMIPNPFQKRPTKGTATTVSSTRTVYISTSRTSSGVWNPSYGAGTLTVTYYNESNQQTTATYTINQNNQPTASLTVKTGTTITCSIVRSSNSQSVSYSAKYDGSSGSEFLSGTSSSSTAVTNSSMVAGTVTMTAANFRGFYAWRVKSLSGGLTITGKSVGSIIYADEEIEFVTSNAYGNEVEFEALWAQAYVTTGTTAMSSGNYATNSGNYKNAYERNFHVVTSSTAASSYQSKGYPLTVTSFYPDGTAAGGSVSGGFSATSETKFENIAITDATGSTWNANGKDFVIGRGVTGTVQNLYGLAGSSSTSFNFRIESGTYTNLAFMGDGTGYGLTSGVMTAIMGCDYDRANNEDNSKLRVTTDIILCHNGTVGNNSEKGKEIFNCTVKSGNYDLGTSNYGGSNQFYISNWGNPITYGKRTLTVEGGNFSDISGGCDDDGTTDVLMVDIRIKGGTMNSAVYGAAQKSEAQGHRRMIITGGDFKGWIAGAANGNDITQTTFNGKLTGNTYLYVGGKARVDSDSSTTLINRSVGGNVFGAGCGYSGSNNVGYVKGNVNVAIADEAYIERGVYGGGSFGYDTTGYTATIYMMGGTVDCIGGGVSVNNQGTASYIGTVKGGVYGGACQNKAGSNIVKMYGGRVNGSVYGGCNVTGDPAGDVTVTVNGGTVTGGVYGCNNVAGSPKGMVEVTINGSDPTVVDGSGNKTYAIGGVYGGGNQADYDPTTPGNYPTVTVNGCETSIKDVYGGGNAAAVPYTHVTINGGDIDRVFGGGNGESGTPANVGNKNQDEVVPPAIPSANNYGTGTSTTIIHGGTINYVFGGSNSHGTIRENITLTIDEDGTCPMHLGQVFAGNNQAPRVGTIVATIPCGTELNEVYGCSNEAFFMGDVTLNIEGGTLGNVYGGSKNADIDGNVTVNVFGGSIDELFGGNNIGGNISGQITVNVDWTTENTCADDKSINYVYGGGNLAAYTPTYSSLLSPRVNIINATVNEAVFGGGYGTTAVVNANPWVVVGADRVKNMAGSAIAPVSNLAVAIGSEKNPLGRTLMGDIFGGGNAAMVVGDPYVVIKGTRTKVSNNVYGGGNAATVVGNTDIQVGYDADIMPPVLTLNGSEMVITSTTAGATIKYTTNGTDPTATTGSDYSSALTLSSGQVIKAIAVKDGKTSAVAYNTVATPTISIDGSNGQATVSCSTPGVTLYYTNGASPADPTTSSSTYNANSKPTVAAGNTIKVLAVRNGFANSVIGSATR